MGGQGPQGRRPAACPARAGLRVKLYSVCRQPLAGARRQRPWAGGAGTGAAVGQQPPHRPPSGLSLQVQPQEPVPAVRDGPLQERAEPAVLPALLQDRLLRVEGRGGNLWRPSPRALSPLAGFAQLPRMVDKHQERLLARVCVLSWAVELGLVPALAAPDKRGAAAAGGGPGSWLSGTVGAVGLQARSCPLSVPHGNRVM